MYRGDRKRIKSWMLQATRGRYQPPTRKTTMDILLTMIVKADNTTKKLMKDLRADRVLLSISGMLFLLSYSCLT